MLLPFTFGRDVRVEWTAAISISLIAGLAGTPRNTLLSRFPFFYHFVTVFFLTILFAVQCQWKNDSGISGRFIRNRSRILWSVRKLVDLRLKCNFRLNESALNVANKITVTLARSVSNSPLAHLAAKNRMERKGEQRSGKFLSVQAERSTHENSKMFVGRNVLRRAFRV